MVSSSQVTVGTLIDKLAKITTVQSVATAHQAFDQRFKTGGHIDPDIRPYSHVILAFAMERLAREYSKSKAMKGLVTDNADGTLVMDNHDVTAVSCTCDRFTSFKIPCRHVFYARHLKALAIVDTSLVDRRWHVEGVVVPCDVQEQPMSTVTTAQVTVPCSTRGQRYNTLLTLFTGMASTLADLPASTFPLCLGWVGALEEKVRSGSWSADMLPQQHAFQLAKRGSSDTHRTLSPEPEDIVSATNNRAVSPPSVPVHTVTVTAEVHPPPVSPRSPVVVSAIEEIHSDPEAQLSPDRHLESWDGDITVAMHCEPDSPPATGVMNAKEHREPSINLPTFKLPSRVRQQGRPQQTKQLTFRRKPKPFNQLTSIDEEEMRVGWFTDNNTAREAVRYRHKVQVRDMNLQNFSRCLDYCALDEIQQYFETDAWQQVVQMKESVKSTCAQCHGESPPLISTKRGKKVN